MTDARQMFTLSFCLKSSLVVRTADDRLRGLTVLVTPARHVTDPYAREENTVTSKRWPDSRNIEFWIWWVFGPRRSTSETTKPPRTISGAGLERLMLQNLLSLRYGNPKLDDARYDRIYLLNRPRKIGQWRGRVTSQRSRVTGGRSIATSFRIISPFSCSSDADAQCH